MSKFGDAFAAARKAGKKTFTYNGKSYHTRTKDDEAKNARKNTAAVSRSAGRKIAARAQTPNTKVTVKAKRPALSPAKVTAKRKTSMKTAPRNVAPSSSAGQRGSAMLKAGTMPGRTKTTTTTKKAPAKTARKSVRQLRGRGR